MVESQSKMIDAIRNEHARVYLQDQALLKTIKENADGKNLGGIDPRQLSVQENEGPEARSELLGQPGDAADENRSQDPAQQQNDENGNNGAGDEYGDEANSQANEEEGGHAPKIVGSKQLLAPYRAATELRRKSDKIYAIKPISLVEADQ